MRRVLLLGVMCVAAFLVELNSGPARVHVYASELSEARRKIEVFLWDSTATAPSAQARTALQVIRDDGALVLTAGGSFYKFSRDSSFSSGPIGVSGRTITGRWRGGDDVFIVEGRWGWLNGVNAGDDFRRMTMRITRIEGPGTVQVIDISGVFDSVRVHSGYHYIDDVVRIPPPASATRAVSGTAATGYQAIRLSTNYMPDVTSVTWTVYDTRFDPHSALEIVYRDAFPASAPPPSQVWLLRNDGTLVAPTRTAVVSGVGFPGAGPPQVAYRYDLAVAPEAAAVIVKLGDEYLFTSLRR